MKRIIILAFALFILVGCVQRLPAAQYSISADNVVALRAYQGKKVAVGSFTGSAPLGLHCGAVGPVVTPDGGPFSEFVRKALVDELKVADVYSDTASVTITGELETINFSLGDNIWNMTLRLGSSNGGSMTVAEVYDYSASTDNNAWGVGTCDLTAKALMPAVQSLIGKVVQSPEFAALIAE